MQNITAVGRRRLLAGASAVTAAAAGLARPAIAQRGRFPDRPIRLIVPWNAGGSADGQFRVLAELASRRLGQPVVVENRPGATGSLGAVALKEARPDGHMLSQIHLSVYRVALLSPRPAYDPVTDFTYIIQLTGSLLGIVVRADSPWQTLDDLLNHARANPGKVNYGTLGVGSSQHLVMAQIGALRGIDWTHIPYRGTAETLTALLGGQIDAAADSSAWAQFVEDGRMRLLCTWGAERPPRFQQTPTLRELGIDLVADSPYGVAGPKGMDPGVVRVLHDALKDALFDPVHLAALARYDQPLLYLDSAAYAEAARRYYETERENLRRVGLLPG